MSCELLYDPGRVQSAIKRNLELGISKVMTARIIAREHGREEPFLRELRRKKEPNGPRRDVVSILEAVCTNAVEYPSSTVIDAECILMPRASTYGQGVYQLKRVCIAEASTIHPQHWLNDGKKIPRPLTFKETIEARVADYDNNADTPKRLRLFETWNDTCTGIAYKGGTTRFKIIPVCKELITIPHYYEQDFLSIDYDDLDGIELDLRDAPYNELLPPDQIENHPAWLAAVGGDTYLLKAYQDIVFAELNSLAAYRDTVLTRFKEDKAMEFWVRTEIPRDQLRALSLHYLNYYSDACGSTSLNNSSSFLCLVERSVLKSRQRR